MSVSSLRTVRAADVAPAPWRNGGGRTRELFAWPAGADWTLRISLAEIDADGPFSAFPGVQRWFAVLSGAGVDLHFADRTCRLDAASAPFAFDGAAAPGCSLVAGPTRDLNLMLRGATRGVLLRASSGIAWSDAWRWRAAYAADTARIVFANGAAVDVDAGTLVAPLPPGACRVDASLPDVPTFWIGADADVET